MKTIFFTYTKENGDISERSLLASKVPSDKYEGLDVSELDHDAFVAAMTDFKKLQDDYIAAYNALAYKHDIATNYRRFSQERMSNIEVV